MGGDQAGDAEQQLDQLSRADHRDIERAQQHRGAGSVAVANGLRAFAGTAPITRASGRSHYVKARKVRNKRLADACHWWAFVTLTKSPGTRAHYDRRRAAGDHHNAAPTQPREQAPGPAVVVPGQPPTMGRTRRMDHLPNTNPKPAAA